MPLWRKVYDALVAVWEVLCAVVYGAAFVAMFVWLYVALLQFLEGR